MGCTENLQLRNALAIETDDLGTVQFQDANDLGILFPSVVAPDGHPSTGPAFFTPVLVIRPALQDWFVEWAHKDGAHLKCRFVWGE